MQIKSIGIDIGKTTLHLIALGSRLSGCGAKEVFSSTTAVYTPICPGR